MRLFGRGHPRRIVVREYGRDSILFAAVNPLMTFVMVGILGMRDPLRVQDRVALAMEKDAMKMAKKSYRIVSSQEYEAPKLGVVYHKVTYELVDPAK